MSENSKKEVLSREELKKIVEKRKKKKIITVVSIIAAVLVVSLTAGLIIWNAVRVKPIKRTEEQAQVVGRVGKYDVYYDEFSYLVGLHKANIEYKYGNINWAGGSELANKCAEYVRDDVLEDIEEIYGIFTLCEKYGIDIDSKEINKEVNEQIKSIIETDFGGKKKDYYTMLEAEGISDAYARLVCKANLLEEDLLYKLVEDGEQIEYSLRNIQDFIEFAKNEDEIMRTTHIYYPKHLEYKDVNIEQTRADAEAVVLALRAISNKNERYEAFNDYIGAAPLVAGYSMTNLDGVYFTYGMMGEDYEGVSAALDDYGVSDVLETEDGFYIIMRLPKEDAYIDKNAETLLSSYQMAQLVLLKGDIAQQLAFDCEDVTALVKKELSK